LVATLRWVISGAMEPKLSTRVVIVTRCE
jgi:hypothetical protein